MKNLDQLNENYVVAKATHKDLRECITSVQKVLKNNSLRDHEKVVQCLSNVDLLCDKNKDYKFDLIIKAQEVAKGYAECLDSIRAYKDALISQDGKVSDREINLIQLSEEEYVRACDEYCKALNKKIDSPISICKAISYGVEEAIKDVEATISQQQNEAREILAVDTSVELRFSDAIPSHLVLPESMLLAKKPTAEVTREILRDIGIKSVYEDIFTELRTQGNVYVNVDFKDMTNEKIDHFVMAYLMRFIETFPLGAVHVHLFDQNTIYLFKRLINGFASDDASELVRRIVQLHESYDDLAGFRDVLCEDIFKKTSVDKPDLYKIYESDKSDPFNLIVIRDGLVDGSGYAQTEMLDTINSLTRPGDMGHKCGFRFLIIDCSDSQQSSLSDSNKHVLDLIKQNCELRIDFSNGVFQVKGEDVEVLTIRDDIDVYVQARSKAIADAIGKKEKAFVAIEDVSANSIEQSIGNIIQIPVGTSSGQSVELPLSCKDEDGTVAGQCIGYMAIGQSGSGKSSFFHSVVLNGCMKYSPKDLQFWLLDFKNGGASSKYRNSGIPHIRIIAENNKIDDALCLFQMVLEEMERRNKAFNKNFTDNIIEYNKVAEERGLEYFPRIIIAIDEVQEIFREDSASEIQKQISSISTRMRSAGMHFIMVAQNLSEGKSYMLKDAFLPSATGRICFRVAQDIPRDSGFGEEFIDRRSEIADLNTGEAYVSYGKGTIRKVKMAFASTKDMSEKYFKAIRERYTDYADMHPLVIGSKAKLGVLDSKQGTNDKYNEIIKALKPQQGMYKVLIGEDAYRMSPMEIRFSQHENSSLLMFGSDKRIASSLCTSVTLSLLRQGVKIHLFNGDRTRLQRDQETARHPFMQVCQCFMDTKDNVENHRLDQLKDVMADLYQEYLKRQELVQKADFEDPDFSPIFLVINDLYGIDSFIQNEIVSNELNEAEKVTESGIPDFSDLGIFKDLEDNLRNEKGGFKERIQTIMNELVKNGYRYNMHVVLAIRGMSSAWRNFRISPELNNILMFNETEYADQVENSYYLKTMLKNVANEGGEETMAVWTSKKTFSKVRPIIYDTFREEEVSAINDLIEGV